MTTATYRAILQGSQVIWVDTPPILSEQTEVEIVIKTPTSYESESGIAMFNALEKLAQIKAFQGIDPIAWQREIRRDKPLVGRE